MAELIRDYMVKRLADNYLAAKKSGIQDDVLRAKNDVRGALLNLEEVKLFEKYVSENDSEQKA